MQQPQDDLDEEVAQTHVPTKNESKVMVQDPLDNQYSTYKSFVIGKIEIDNEIHGQDV